MRKTYSTVFVLILLFSAVSFAQQSKSRQFASNSVLASGNWYKIATIKDGVYKLSYKDLISSGALPPFNSVNFKLYGNGGEMLPEKIADFRFDDLIENNVQVVDGGDGYIDANDYVLFYGQGTTEWTFNALQQSFSQKINFYADSAYYFFTFDNGAGKRIVQSPTITGNPDIIVDTYDDLTMHELDSLNLLKSGKRWVGEVFNDGSPRVFKFAFQDLVDSANLDVAISLLARSIQKSAFQININGQLSSDTIMPVDGNITSEYARSKIVQIKLIPNTDTITISLTYNKPEVSSVGWLNYIKIEAERKLVYRQQQIKFRNIRTIGKTVSQFNFDNLGNQFKVWHIGDSANISEIPLLTIGALSTFKTNTQSLTEFVAFDVNNLYHPSLLGQIQNQNLHGLPQLDYVIVTNPRFLSQANTLADFHRNTGQLKVAVATTQQIYNEFSSGKQDPTAIRDFIRMFYDRGTDSLSRIKYLLLFGDGSYDMKNRIANNSNMIPTWQTDNSLTPISSYVSDDFFGMLDSNEGINLNGDIDVGVGRFPVNTIEEANNIVSKSLRYGSAKDEIENSFETGTISNYDPWRNNICFVADDEDGNLHYNQTEKMVLMLDSITNDLNVNKIYLDAYKQIHTPSGDRYPEVNACVDENIKKGSLLLNYVGHGGELGLASEGILTFSEIGKYSNYNCLPVFVTATCEFSRYDNPELESAGEKILLNPDGGSIAMFSTTRIAFAHSNEIVNRNLLKTAFTESQDKKIRFGDIIKISKNNCGAGVYKQNFTLLGDPALSLAIPEYKVVTEKLTCDNVDISGDTIFNSNIITVKGYIGDNNRDKQDWFNGKIYPYVFDKPIEVTTLANDPSQSFITNFDLQQSVLYKGMATIKNGEFEFSFFAPTDISFGDGFGKILYYAKSSLFDAHGVTDSLLIKNNGFNNNPDVTGPEISIFMEDKSFIDGGETSADPTMYAYLHDTSGINSFGLGIGHEIVAELDEDVNNPYYLNDYFSLDADKYSSGQISFRFSNLTYGMHKLKLSAWDLLNNNSEKEITFNVKSPTGIELEGVYNYPDPVEDHTTFVIERNMSTEIMFVKISITDITGKICTEIEQDVLPGSYKPLEIAWNITNNNGVKLPKGFYLYTVSLTDNDGKIRQKSDKMVIIK